MTAMLALTFGAGRRNSRGQTVELPRHDALPGVLESHQTGREAWWSTHTWDDGHRSGERWLSSAGVMVDLDYHDAADHHVAPPENIAQALRQAAHEGALPGSVFHPTPRGARVIFLFGDQCTDRDLFLRAAHGAAVLVRQALEGLQGHPGVKGQAGYRIDQKVLTDLARLLFAPNTIVGFKQKDGSTRWETRSADVLTMQEQPFEPEALARLAEPEPEPAPEPSRPAGQPSLDLADAIRRWNLDHRQEWPRNSKRCPMCGGSESFGTLPGDSERWFCFSDKHASPGLRGQGGYHGDALDLEAHRRGCKPVDVLRQDGYLQPMAQSRPRLVPPPDNVVPFEQPEQHLEIGKTFASLCAILRHERRVIPEPLELNEMLLAPTIGGEAVTDATAAAIREKIELTITDSKGKGLRFSSADIDQAIMRVASESPYHPVQEYLQGLKWDGVERIDHLCEDVLGAARSELHMAMIRKWFISAVARPLDPGCKVDTVLILKGPQGAKKSTFFAELAGSEWFADSPIDIQHKDSYILLRRVWILEWAELEAMQRARDSSAVKAFVSSRVDVFRPPYGKRMIDAKRHCVIVGSTNEDDILSDPTGNRRYWILPVADELNMDGLRGQRDQLWAEAVHRYRAGEQWWLEPHLEAQLRESQTAYERRDPWEDKVLRYVEAQALPPSSGQILEHAIQKYAGQWTTADARRVAAILKQAGYAPQRQRAGGAIQRVWVRADAAS